MKAIVDIGELGWSMYLSGKFKYLKHHGEAVKVISYPDRRALYCGADEFITIPGAFMLEYGHFPNEGFGKASVSSASLEAFFLPYLGGAELVHDFNLDLQKLGPVLMGAYPIRKKILVFPRCREHPDYAKRNLSRIFYARLMARLCRDYSGHDIVAVGKVDAYGICLAYPNYINKVTSGCTLQDVLDLCALSIAAIGGTSSLPKISALQMVPTFVIGHELERFTARENWSKTRMGFYRVPPGEYNTLEFTQDIYQRIRDFIDRKEI